MAWISIRHGDKDLGWRELDGPVTVGRHRECDIWVMDSRLSRTHCRFEQVGDDWAAVDLESRNGTWCDGISVDRVLLLEGDEVYVGRCLLTYHTGTPPESGRFEPRGLYRPADPQEALEGTMVGVTVVERPRDPWVARSARIRPRPIPREVDLEPRPTGTGLLDLPVADEEADLRPISNLPRTRFLPRAIMLELPTMEELEAAPMEAPAEPVVVEPVAVEPAPDAALEPAMAAGTAHSVNLDFWFFLMLTLLTGAGAWTVWRMVPGF